MKARRWAAWLTASVFAGLGAGIGTGGCQDVATCASICALPGAPDGCEDDCSQVEGSCAQVGASADFQEYLTCVENNGTFPSTSDGACTPEATVVTNQCPTPSSSAGDSPVDAGTGGDAVMATGPCTLGGGCSMPGAGCTVEGAGPCNSDERLSCDPSSLTFVADGFPCTSPSNTGCGFGSAGPSGGCTETCVCSGGLMRCTGDCPDGGPSSP